MNAHESPGNARPYLPGMPQAEFSFQPSTLLTAAERRALSAAVARERMPEFAKRSGASESAVIRALAGLPVRAGSCALLRLALAAPPDAA